VLDLGGAWPSGWGDGDNFGGGGELGDDGDPPGSVSAVPSGDGVLLGAGGGGEGRVSKGDNGGSPCSPTGS
jgi:hypothetical protein